MSELSHFEELSAQTPKKEPYAILIGTVILAVALVVLNKLSPTEPVRELKAAQEAMPTAVQPADDGDEI
ncbi:MAG: hypothetical protein QNJ97_06945 [Myxococcota bacterium]|nr:hypothetical protein [Myxococcota bacterium]